MTAAPARPGRCLLDACTQACTTECREVINQAWRSLRGTQLSAAPARHTVDSITSDQLDQLYVRLEMAEAKASELDRAGDIALSAVRLMQAAGARAEKAEAAVERVRALAERWRHTGDRKHGPLRELRAVLDQHGQTPA